MNLQTPYLMPGNSRIHLSQTTLTFLVSLFLVAFSNLAFFRNLIEVYPPSFQHILFTGSLIILMTGLTSLLLMPLATRYTIRPWLITVVLLSSLAAYFMDSYNIVIDETMLQNVAATDTGESRDLLSFKLLWYFLFLGVLPAVFIYKVNIRRQTLPREIGAKVKLLLIAILLIVSQLLLMGKTYASFFREHKPLRQYANPAFYLFSAGKYTSQLAANTDTTVTPIGEDAQIAADDTERELLIFVVGETARADHFSLNGYPKQTNPRLAKENVISLPNMSSCGTSTAVSVPCMFSLFGRDDYSDQHGRDTENLLDVVSHAGVHTLWRDNNSDSKGVALRVPYEDFKTPKKNPVCDIECRDEGMLVDLQTYINQTPKGDILIVLHQMGNHGPAYYKRYPKSFEKFTPACQSNLLNECSQEEINNAYDNAILYTDHFLAQVIKLLKANSRDFETAMIYVSDHGESLGEKGLYLHGMPYFMAPKAQTNPAAVLWFGESYDDIDMDAVKARATAKVSHDNIFHTVLGLLEIQADVYDPSLDIVHGHTQISDHAKPAKLSRKP